MLTKILDKVCKVVLWTCMLLLAIFLTVVVVAVFFRYVLNNSLTWSEQVSRFLFVWMIMLMLPIMFREKRDISFDILTKHLPKSMQKWIVLLLDVLIVAFAAFFGYNGLIYTIEHGSKIISGINIPQGFLYVSEPISGALLTLSAIESVINDAKAVFFRKEAQ